MIELLAFAIVYLGSLVATLYVLDRFVFDVRNRKRMASLAARKAAAERMLRSVQDRKKVGK